MPEMYRLHEGRGHRRPVLERGRELEAGDGGEGRGIEGRIAGRLRNLGGFLGDPSGLVHMKPQNDFPFNAPGKERWWVLDRRGRVDRDRRILAPADRLVLGKADGIPVGTGTG